MRYASNLYGLGYDNSRPDKGYKILELRYFEEYVDGRTIIVSEVSIYDFATNWWRKLELGPIDWHLTSPRTVLFLNGTLYWIAERVNSGGHCFVQSFDFSAEMFKPFCLSLPCTGRIKVLQIFRGDRLSVLEQCMKTKNITIWVTKNMISRDHNESVSWRVLLTVSIPNIPALQDSFFSKSQPSYFIDNNDDKKLIVCTCDKTGKPCIYIMKGDRVKKILVDIKCKLWPKHFVYVPSLVHIPLPQELQK